MQYDIDLVSKEFRINIQDLFHLYRTYINLVQDNFSQIDTLIINSDWNMVEKLIHKIKGMSGNLRILDVYEETKIINDLIVQNDYEKLYEKFQTLKATFSEARKGIIKAFKDKGLETVEKEFLQTSSN